MKYKNHNPFQVPKGYFNILEEKLLKKTKINLNAYGYNIPKDYFNKLEKEIIKKTYKISKRKNNKKLKGSLLALTGIAVSISLFYNIFLSEKPIIIEKEEVFEDFVESYYLEDLNTYEILSMLDENDIETTLKYSPKP
ncbi:MAG: hypothetical protein CBD68_03360 [Flavobacteriaceae bacterium TMED208]|nr:MAG: hypothetical protein CBD68_03360 [Flavobacteriaceae bacterium TMED208]|tara:strand:+ start:846 stop:1259 length:414 start_codon:yes stop_codon:yes gene_type:complete